MMEYCLILIKYEDLYNYIKNNNVVSDKKWEYEYDEFIFVDYVWESFVKVKKKNNIYFYKSW